MTIAEKFNLIYTTGKTVCAAYTGFSKLEIAYCQQKSNWNCLQSFLMSKKPYEALIHFSLQPPTNIVGYFQIFVGCMMQFPDEEQNNRLNNLLYIIDTEDAFDAVLTNSRMMRALLAISVKYVKSNPAKYLWLFYNSKRVLAHILKKYPDYFNLNILKTNKKSKSLRFKKEEIEIFW